MINLNINTDAAVVFTNKLEKLHRSALPVAIRNTLNNVVFDIKQNTSLMVASSTFTQRNKAFFKRSRIKPAKGFNVKSMTAIIGFIGGDQSQAIRDLEQQEKGGVIKGRSFIPMDTSRTSKSKSKLVRKPNRLGSIRNIDRVKNQKLFHKTVRKAGVGGFILYRGTLFQVKSIQRKNVKLLPLFSYDKGRDVKVDQTNFMKRATLMSGQKMEGFYKTQALKQINRLRK